MIESFRPLPGIAMTWAFLWFTGMAVVGVTIGIVDPDSIDPGEPLQFVFVMGPMAFFSGLAFAFLLLRNRVMSPSLVRAIGYGILGSALVQIPYLGHGDVGLVANMIMAMVFAAFGGLVSVVWFVLARKRYVRTHETMTP